MSEKKDVDRAAAADDQVWIDFKGVNEKGEPVNGADGKDYPIILGSNTFIPGFEDNVVGMSVGEEKSFTLTFPKDYGVKALANKKVTFTVTVTKVQEVIEPKVDDEFAAKAGPFKTVKELKEDIKKQVQSERQYEADRNFEAELIRQISQKTSVALPQVLIEEQIERYLRELKQNVAYRGMTWQEYLEAEGMSEEDYKQNVVQPQAEERLKASLVLAEIAEKEGLEVTPEELEVRMQILKGQYQDAAMQTELEKPEARRDIAARMLTEKTIARLIDYAAK
jgi:trigger factor